VPASVVYHFEGMTSGTDVSSGFKKYQEVNRPKFKRRWASACTGFGQEGKMPDLEKDRGIVGRVLFIDYTTPQADKDAGSYAAIQEMKLVQSLGYKVTFLPENMAHVGAYTNDLERNGIEVITAPFYPSIPSFLEKRGAEFDAFYITRYYVAQSTIDKIRQVAPRAKILFNNADLHFLRQFRSALSNNDAAAMEAARDVRREELEIICKADVTLSYNEIEHSVILSHTEGAAKVVKCPWVVDLPADVAPFETRSGLSFLGGFKHYPNVDGIKWFTSTVMPLFVSKPGKLSPPIHLSIYGSAMGEDIKALASDTITPVGFVDNIADSYDRHRIFIAPLLSGAGIKGKVLGALAHGVPCILSPVAAEGIGLRHGHDCLIAQTPDQWVKAVLQLYDDPKLWARMSDNARTYVADSFSFETGRTMMRAAFEAVEMFGSKD
jgi:glycosyltransferase involved in cell wall biosynthesis